MTEPDKDHPAYIAGWDVGMNGPTMSNCNFSLFNDPESLKLWSLGKTDAMAWKEKAHG